MPQTDEEKAGHGVRTCVVCRARSTESGTRELRRLCPLFAERAQEGGNVVMSGVVDSGRLGRHGNVDANDPQAAMDIASRIIWLGQS
jgi:hypothetical protein